MYSQDIFVGHLRGVFCDDIFTRHFLQDNTLNTPRTFYWAKMTGADDIAPIFSHTGNGNALGAQLKDRVDRRLWVYRGTPLVRARRTYCVLDVRIFIHTRANQALTSWCRCQYWKWRRHSRGRWMFWGGFHQTRIERSWFRYFLGIFTTCKSYNFEVNGSPKLYFRNGVLTSWASGTDVSISRSPA